MVSDATVRARIDETTKAEAQRVLAEMGLTVSDAIRMMLVRVAAEHALPFEVKVPNAATRAALDAAAEGDTKRFGSVSDLMADLNADD